MSLGPTPYRFFDTVESRGVILNMERFEVIGETPHCWYIAPDWMAPWPNVKLKQGPHVKRVLKALGGRRFAYPSLQDAMHSYQQRKKWQITHAKNSLERAKAGQAQALLALESPIESWEPTVCPGGEYFKEMNWTEC